MANRISVVIDVVADRATTSLKNFKKSVAEADGAFNKLKAGGSSAMGALKANAAIVGPAIGAAMLGGAKIAIDAASELEESMNAVNVTFGETAEGIHALGESSVESFGLSRSVFNSAAVQFSAFAKQVAGPGGDVVATMDDLLTRATDFASVMNLDLNTAMGVFQSSLAGQTEPIRAYGKDLSAAAVEQYALENGLAASKKEMTESIKVQARYGLLMRETNDVAGDFANTSESLANQQKILEANLTDLSAQIGTHLVPAVAEATSGMNDLLEVADRLGLIDVAFKIREVTSPTKALGRAMDVTTGQTDLFGKKINEVTQGQFDFIKSAKEAGWETERINAAMAAGATGSVAQWAQSQRWAGVAAHETSKSVEDLTDATDDAAESTEDLDRNVKELTEAFEDQLDASKDLRDERRDLAGITLDAADAEDDFQEAVRKLTETNEDAEASEIDKSRALRDTIRSTDDMVRAQLEANGVIVNSKDGNRQWTKSMMDAAFFMGGELGGEILAHTARVNGIPEEKITEIQALLDKGDVAAARRLMDAELSRAEARVTVTPVGLEAARARISAILGRNISIGVNTYTPRRPGSGGTRYGASGGLVTRPTQALIGEAGPELVLPLNKGPLSGALGASPLSSLGGGGGGNIYLTVNADSLTNGNDVGRKITEALREYQARGGQRLS